MKKEITKIKKPLFVGAIIMAFFASHSFAANVDLEFNDSDNVLELNHSDLVRLMGEERGLKLNLLGVQKANGERCMMEIYVKKEDIQRGNLNRVEVLNDLEGHSAVLEKKSEAGMTSFFGTAKRNDNIEGKVNISLATDFSSYSYDFTQYNLFLSFALKALETTPFKDKAKVCIFNEAQKVESIL